MTPAHRPPTPPDGSPDRRLDQWLGEAAAATEHVRAPAGLVPAVLQRIAVEQAGSPMGRGAGSRLERPGWWIAAGIAAAATLVAAFLLGMRMGEREGGDRVAQGPQRSGEGAPAKGFLGDGPRGGQFDEDDVAKALRDAEEFGSADPGRRSDGGRYGAAGGANAPGLLAGSVPRSSDGRYHVMVDAAADALDAILREARESFATAGGWHSSAAAPALEEAELVLTLVECDRLLARLTASLGGRLRPLLLDGDGMLHSVSGVMTPPRVEQAGAGDASAGRTAESAARILLVVHRPAR